MVWLYRKIAALWLPLLLLTSARRQEGIVSVSPVYLPATPMMKKQTQQIGSLQVHMALRSEAHRNSLRVQRPIITGCLEECGIEDTQCVTECQVCIEKRACGSLGTCAICREGVLTAKRAHTSLEPGTIDSGSKSLVHEQISQRFELSKFHLDDMHHRLALARSNVITAQREVEWTSAERHEKALSLRHARRDHQDAKDEADHYGRKFDEEVYHAEERERAAEEKKSEEKRELKEARRDMARIKKAESVKKDKKDMKKLENKEHEAEAEIRKEKQQLQEAKRLVEKRHQKVEWIKHHLAEEADEAGDEIHVARLELRHAEEVEELADRALAKATRVYANELEASEQANQVTKEIHRELAENPLPEDYRRLPAPQKGSTQRGSVMVSMVCLLMCLSSC